MTPMKSGINTRMHLMEMQRNFVEDIQVLAEKLDTIKNDGPAKSHRQYMKRRKSGRLLKRPRWTEISPMGGCCLWTEGKQQTDRWTRPVMIWKQTRTAYLLLYSWVTSIWYL